MVTCRGMVVILRREDGMLAGKIAMAINLRSKEEKQAEKDMEAG